MSDPIDGTRDQTPEEARRILSALRPVFATGEPVPGLSSWVLERRLGGGGFGEVWLVKHAWDAEQKPRAVKFCTDPAAKNRLVTHEQNVVRRVMKYAGKHPNIVPLLDCNLDGDIPWLMYEFVEGGTLADAMRAWRELPVPKRLGRAVRVLHAIAGALGTFHRFDPPLVHRDLKPLNVLMAGSVPRITDFGIGGVVIQPNDGTTDALTAHAARLPSALHAAGTALYAPPEQRFGSPPDPRDDVYALGIIAYQMVLADLTVVPGADAALELRDLKVPGELVSLIVASVAMNADRRPRDASAWESSLAALLQKSQKQPGRADTSVTGSKPILLSEPDPTARSEGQPPRSGANDFAVPVPEPTAGLPARTVPSPLSPPLPVALELPPVPPPVVARPVRTSRKPAKPTYPGRYVALAVGGVTALALVAALVIVLLPSGKQTDPSQVSVKSDPKGDDAKVTAPNPKGDGSKGGSDGSQVPKKEPEPEPKKSDPKKEPEPKAVLPKAGDTREVEIAPGVKMTFCWVPPGTAMLGSPKGEAQRLTDEVEHEYTSQGFWLGKYEVTQAEWKAVMGDNPSYFNGEKANNAKGLDTKRFPVESVSWDMICGKDGTGGFLAKVNSHGGIEKSFGKPGKFRLPKEDEWEFAARVGRGNEQPFYWGKELNGTQANSDGNSPSGTVTKGPCLERTCAVDFTNDGKYEQHPWGLMHMHGNVWEWCEDLYDKTNNRRVLRGGSWGNFARFCRAASRNDYAPGNDLDFIGFRLLVPGLP